MARGESRKREALETLLKILLGVFAGSSLSALALQLDPILLLAVYTTALLILITYFVFRELGRISSILETEHGITRIVSDDEKELVKHFIKIIKLADQYIMCTGGISRQEKYLKAIEMKVKKKMEYWRVFAGPEITEEMYIHLRQVFLNKNVHVGLLDNGTIYTHVMVTEDVAIVALPDPAMFRTFLVTRDRDVVDRIKMYVQQLCGQAEEIDLERLEEMVTKEVINIKPARD